MLKLVILTVVFVVCAAAPPQPDAKPQPAATPQGATPHAVPLPSPVQGPQSGVYCGETPNKVFSCLQSPKFIDSASAKKCSENLSECDKIKCIFRRSGWSTASSTKDDTINKQKVAEYYTQYAVDNPLWTAAVTHLKVACLDKDLPPQGPHLNCAAYDVMHCIFISFLKNASPAQWLSKTECEHPRAYATSCPVCPDSCFAPQVPIGTCNACQSLPRTP